jgi:hypothetical protein
MALKGQVEHGVKEGMPWADEGRKRLVRRRDQILLENDPLVAREHWIAASDLAIAVSHRRGHVRDLVATSLSLPDGAAEAPKRLEEEGLDVVRLEAPRFGSHKLSASFFGGELKYTKRYRLGQLLSGLTRHFLLDLSRLLSGVDASPSACRSAARSASRAGTARPVEGPRFQEKRFYMQRAHLISFGLAGHGIDITDTRQDGVRSKGRISGYDSPESFERALARGEKAEYPPLAGVPRSRFSCPIHSRSIRSESAGD